MADKMGMDIDEFSERSLEIGKGLTRLCDDMYAATEDDATKDEIEALINQGEHKINLYNKLYEETSGGMRDGLQRKYESYIEEIRKFSLELMENKND